jgi:poly-gamma-glutamate synthesis protein (capsule biosynthesis protein)
LGTVSSSTVDQRRDAERLAGPVGTPDACSSARTAGTITLLLAGDVMTGRGIDQALPHPLPPVLYEPWVTDARTYLRLAERANGPVGAPLRAGDPWGDALDAVAAWTPDVRIVNLETAVTTSDTPWPGKGIHYRMNPAHVDVLQAGGIQVCALANNHVLDWGVDGLRETLAVLQRAGIACAGAGADLQQAQQPAIRPLPGGGRLLLFAWCTHDSGVPREWAATSERAGVALLPALDETQLSHMLAQIDAQRRAGDRVVVSLHWGDNWVHALPAAHRVFARRLVDSGAVDVVHGHSSHHPLPLERHAGKLILYGCGDLINDYEGIGAHGSLRSDLGCLYAATLARADGALQRLEIVPLQLRRFRLGRPQPDALQWLREQWIPACAALGSTIDASLPTRWRLV